MRFLQTAATGWVTHPAASTVLTMAIAWLCLTGGANGENVDALPQTKIPDNSTLPAKFQQLVPLHRPLGQPGPGDWLASHPEPGQTYGQYLAAGRSAPTSDVV